MEKVISSTLWKINPANKESSKDMYEPPITLGTSIVSNIHAPGSPGSEWLELALTPYDDRDTSRPIRGLPDHIFHEGQTVEVIGSKYTGGKNPSTGQLEILDNGGFWVIAVRPYTLETFKSPVDPDDPIIKKMFDNNNKSCTQSPAFFEEFFPNEPTVEKTIKYLEVYLEKHPE